MPKPLTSYATINVSLVLASLLMLAATNSGASQPAVQTEQEAEWTNDLRSPADAGTKLRTGLYDEPCVNTRSSTPRSPTVRAHCLDKRQFDFTWADKDMKFTIERCGPAVC